MFIDIVCDFKDGHTPYFEGERRKLPEADAQRFISYGWASVPGADPLPLPTGTASELTIQNGQHGQLSEVR